MGHSQKRIYN